MTTVVSNSSGRSGGGKSVRKNQSSNASHSVGDHNSQKDNNEKFQVCLKFLFFFKQVLN